MAATKYTVTATTAHEAKTFSRKEYAVREAELRAEALRRAEAVTVTTSTGKTVHTTEVIQPKTPSNRGQRRTAIGAADQPGWEVLYNKPRKQAQVWRTVEEPHAYLLYCTVHGTTFALNRLADDRALLRDGGWCRVCTDEETEADMVDNEVGDDIAAGTITQQHLALLKAVNAAATEHGVWDPNAAALVAPLGELEALGLVETVDNSDMDEANLWAYLTDKGDAALANA